MSKEEMVTIPKAEYEGLLRNRKWLDCLEEAGVDNWEGICFAYDIKRDRDKEGE